MGSSRLPNKTLESIWNGMSLIELVLRRTLAAEEPDGVVLATTDRKEDGVLAELAKSLGAAVFRGDVDDVLSRFASALAAYPCDAIVRICADNPFVDPAEIDRLVRFFCEAQPLDYAETIGAKSGLPDGSGAEILTAAALRHAAATATEVVEREHVTAHMRARPDEFLVAIPEPPGPSWPRLKLDVDSAADLERMRALARRLPAVGAPLWPLTEIVDAYNASSAAQGNRRL